MINTQCELLAAAGVRGVHLGMSSRNDAAAQFYRKLGFFEIARDGGSADDHTVFLAKWVAPVPPQLSTRPAVVPGTPKMCGVIEGFYGQPWSFEVSSICTPFAMV